MKIWLLLFIEVVHLQLYHWFYQGLCFSALEIGLVMVHGYFSE